MLRLAVKQVLARRVRLALTTLAVVLGVTFVAGTLVLTDTSQRLYEDQFRTATAGVDLTVRAEVAFDSAMGVEVERDPVPPSVVTKLRRVPGVDRVEPVVTGEGLLEVRGEAVVPRRSSMLSSWVGRPLSAFELRQGRAPRRPGEVVLDLATARTHHVALGDTVSVQADRIATLTVVGLAGFGDTAGLPDTTVALVSLNQAQRLLGLGPKVSEIRVTAAPETSVTGLQDRVADTVGSRYAVTTSQDLAAAGAAAARTSLAYLQVMLLVLAAVSLLIGGYLIANTFSVVVTQRIRELAVLRAAGATGRQVFAMVLCEAVVVGAAGSAVGVLLGVLAAEGLRDLAGGFGVALPEGPLAVSPRSLLLAFVVGVAVTVVAALAPGRRAARVSPVEAMRDSTAVVVTGRSRVALGVAGAVVMTGGVVAVMAGASLMALVPAGLGCVAALSLLGPVLVPTPARLLARPFRAGGAVGHLAGEFTARAPRRTAATVMALTLSVTMISLVAVVTGSVKASIAADYQETVSADFVVESSRAEMLGGLDPGVYEHVAAVDGVAVASRLRYGHWKDGRRTSALTAIDPDTVAEVASLDLEAGRLTALDRGGVVVAHKVADARGLHVGSTLPMTFARTGVRPMEVVGVLADDDAQALRTDYVISLGTFRRLFNERVDATVFLKVAEGADTAATGRALERALADYPTAQVRDQAAAVESRTAMVDQILGLVTVLLLLTVVIALLGITNTLALSIVERTREIGLLRAVGMSRGQLRWMVRGEALLMSAVAVTLGVALGTGFGAAAVQGLGGGSEVTVVVPFGRLAGVVVVVALAGLVAGLLPARRASRLPVLEALNEV
jgi:putative ABC transport system permease protein